MTLPAPASIFESTYTASGSFADPGGSGWAATVDYGDGSGTQALALMGNTFTLQHAYTEVGSSSISVSVTNGRGGVGYGTEGVTVKSAPPAISMPSGQTAILGAHNTTGSFSDSDVAGDSFTATVDYGDGTGVHTLALGGAFRLSHTYSLTVLQGYTVTVTITDDDGASATATATATVIL